MRLLVQATTSYFIKFCPYKTVWTTIWIVNGIIQSILKRGIEPFAISFVIMLMPYIVQAIIKGLDGLDDRWRVKQCLEKKEKEKYSKVYRRLPTEKLEEKVTKKNRGYTKDE